MKTSCGYSISDDYFRTLWKTLIGWATSSSRSSAPRKRMKHSEHIYAEKKKKIPKIEFISPDAIQFTFRNVLFSGFAAERRSSVDDVTRICSIEWISFETLIASQLREHCGRSLNSITRKTFASSHTDWTWHNSPTPPIAWAWAIETSLPDMKNSRACFTCVASQSHCVADSAGESRTCMLKAKEECEREEDGWWISWSKQLAKHEFARVDFLAACCLSRP